MDPLERERLRRKLADRMRAFLHGGQSVTCVSAHFQPEPGGCDLCLQPHVVEQVVIRNRAGDKMHVATACLLEMVRFQVTEAVDFPKWLAKLKELKADHERREQARLLEREKERARLEKKFIVRRRTGPSGSNP